MKKLLFFISLLLLSGSLLAQNAMLFGQSGFGTIDVADWDISNASYDNRLYVNPEESVAQGVFVGKNGEKMFITGHGQDKIIQYTMSSHWDVSTATYNGKFLDISSKTNYPQDLCFDRSGKHLYFVDASNARIYHYTLAESWEIDTATETDFLYVGGSAGSPDGVFISRTGDMLFVISDATDEVSTWELTTNFVANGGVYSATKKVDISAKTGTPGAVAFSNDGMTFWITGRIEDDVYEYSVSSAWDLSSTVNYVREVYVVSHGNSPDGLCFARNGKWMYVLSNDDYVNRWNLVAPPLPKPIPSPQQ